MRLGERIKHSQHSLGIKKTFSNSLGNRIQSNQENNKSIVNSRDNAPKLSPMERPHR